LQFSKSRKSNQEDEDDTYGIEEIDADEYFSNNSKVITEIKVGNSKSVQTEKEVCTDLEERGFSQMEIYTNYGMDGTFFDEAAVEREASEKHPSYQTYYITQNEELWTVFSINGVVMANPVSYNLQSELPAQLIISESETVTSYDSNTNKFYETIPNESELIIKTVEIIDAETLEKLTIEEIDKL
jgi:hypothetical protein